MADSTGETIQQRAYRLLEAIRATTENSHQPVFVAELAPGLQMNEGEVRGAFRYLKGKRWIDTFNIDYTARINAAGHDVVAEVGRMTAADAKSSQPDESLIGSSEVKRDPTIEWDVFISHASEDKESFVRPLANRLQEQGLRVWFDELTLTVGDSLRRSIDRGLAKSRYGIVVISPNFLRKEWPQKELDGLVAREIDGVKILLPVWHNIGAAEIRAYRLYLPKDWTKDRARRKKAGVPSKIGFKTKPEIALEQIRWACEAGLPRGVGLMDVAYGNDSRLRAGMTALDVPYVAGIQPNTLMWRSGTGPRRKGKPLNNTGRRDEPDLISAKEVMLGLPKRAWRTVRWREGSTDWLSSRFARVRVGVGHNQLDPGSLLREWLLIEWPEDEAEPTKYWLSTLPSNVSFRRLVDLAKMRWRIERDYQELKQEVGLGHYEGRGWRGFHHHATLCIAAYGFLIAERATIPPSGPRSAAPFQAPVLPDNYRPRGSARAA
jgi:DDE superfamily endonuclease/TIR domain